MKENNTTSLIDKYAGKSLLFIGPGQSKNNVDLNKWISSVDHTACLNDGLFYSTTDLYFVGEQFIYDYILSNKEKIKDFDKVIKLFLGISKKHDKRIDRTYFEKIESNNCHFITNKKTEPISDYSLPLLKEFTRKNMEVLSNLLNRFPNKLEYIRSRTLSNALQIIHVLGFTKVYIIGFMDSITFKRADYTHQKEYVETARKIHKDLRSPQETPPEDLKNSFYYQSQVLKTIDFVYKKNNRIIYNLCPQEMSPIKTFDYIT